MRYAIAAVVLVLTGCAGSPTGKPKDTRPATAEDAKLTDDQQAAWKKLRRASDKPYFVVALTAEGWEMCELDPREDKFIGLTNVLGTPHLGLRDEKRDGVMLGQSGGAIEFAKRAAGKVSVRAAGKVSVRAAAIVDLFTNESPKVVMWVRDDGNGAKESDSAPDEDAAVSLDRYLLRLQARAESLKPRAY